MEMKKGHAEEHENDERWLLTYADLITLLMVFFVVMYSMSQTDAQKFKQLAAALTQVFNNPASSPVMGGGQPVPTNSVMPNRAEGESRKGTRFPKSDGDVRTRRIQALKSDLDTVMQQRGLSQSVSTKVDPKGPKLIMELSDSLLFDQGSADLTPGALELLQPVGEVLAARNYNIHVEGHTDNLPISGRYRNNFELSTSRAVNVIENLITKGNLPPQLFSASGYGEYRPVASNDTPEGRAKNRRVDFVIYDENVADSLDSMLGPAETVPKGDPASLVAPAPGSAAVETSAKPAEPGAATAAPAATEPPAEPAAAPATAATETHAAPAATAAPALDTPVSTHTDAKESHQSLSETIALPKSKSAH